MVSNGTLEVRCTSGSILGISIMKNVMCFSWVLMGSQLNMAPNEWQVSIVQCKSPVMTS